MKSNPLVSLFDINSIEWSMLYQKAGKRGTRNRGRYQVAQSGLNRLYIHLEKAECRFHPGAIIFKNPAKIHKAWTEIRKTVLKCWYV